MDRGGSGVNNAMVTEGAVARDTKMTWGMTRRTTLELEVEASSESPVTFTELYTASSNRWSVSRR